MSRYNPLDMFGTAANLSSSSSSSAGDASAVASGASAGTDASCTEVLARQQAALAALLECPYNNLKVRYVVTLKITES
jgi:hypothetical protein